MDIVNCGAHPWSKEWGQVQRTTAAHSTLVVDNTNSAMLLPHGGMALRPGVVTCRREETDGQIWLDTSHDGYEEGFGLVHRRKLYLSLDGNDFMGEEHLVGPGGNAYALRFHLHPQVSVSVTQNGQSAFIKMPKGSGWRLRVDGAELRDIRARHIGMVFQSVALLPHVDPLDGDPENSDSHFMTKSSAQRGPGARSSSAAASRNRNWSRSPGSAASRSSRW